MILSAYVMQLPRRKKVVIKPQPPKFPVSPQLTVSVGQAQHTVVYGPYTSDKHHLSLVPYSQTAGLSFSSTGYNFYLASNSRIMNSLYRPKTSDNGETREAYYSKQRSTNQKSAAPAQAELLEKLCGVSLDDIPEQFEELKALLNDYKVISLFGHSATTCQADVRFTL